MEWLNYHHLLYFWTVAREGSIARATRVLGLAQPTISAQLRQLEARLGVPLFERRGRSLVLTDVGRTVFEYADEIFSIGRELMGVVRDRSAGRARRFAVGVTDSVPKLVAYLLLEPVFRIEEPVHLVCREGPMSRLLAELALHDLDLVIADTPIPPQVGVRGFSHLLGECGVAIFGKARLAARCRRDFPRTLDGAPMLFPTAESVLRRSLEQWFEAHDVRPRMVGEFDDSALLKVFAQAGHGLFAGPDAIEGEICRQYGVRRVGRLPEVRERFYAISAERRLRHPWVIALTETARGTLFR